MFASPYPDVHIPDLTIYDFLFGSLEDSDRDQVAIVDPGSGAETTYGELVARIDALAGAFAARGIGPGTVVGMLSPNIPTFPAVFHGLLRAGSTVTTLNTLFGAEEIGKQLADSSATWIVTVSPLLPQVIAAAGEIGLAADHVIVLDGAAGHEGLADLLSEQRTPPELTIDPATHVAVLPYSSGTTGVAKGVMLSHRNLVANVQQSQVVVPVSHSDRVLAVLPFFHIYGMTVLLNLALARRAALVTMPRFDLVDFLTTIQDRGCTFIFIAPPIAVALAKHPIVDQFDISSVNTLFSGAAPLDGETGRRAAERINARMFQGYGMTELSPVSHATPADRPDIPLDSIGVTLPNIVCRLVDPATGTEIVEIEADGFTKPGELWVSGPNVMLGYLGNPEATAQTIDEDGFLHTGDVATYHEDGYFTIIDRVKELIKYKGYQVAPAELEALLLSNSDIADAAVIGVLDEEGQEVPKAFVVRAEGSAIDAEWIMAFVAERVAPYKKIRRVEFIDQIPKSSAGKILRKDLRSREPVG